MVLYSCYEFLLIFSSFGSLIVNIFSLQKCEFCQWKFWVSRFVLNQCMCTPLPYHLHVHWFIMQLIITYQYWVIIKFEFLSFVFCHKLFQFSDWVLFVCYCSIYFIHFLIIWSYNVALLLVWSLHQYVTALLGKIECKSRYIDAPTYFSNVSTL